MNDNIHSKECGCILCGGCILCANGRDLPEGEMCQSCHRVGPAIHDHGLRLRAVSNEEVRQAVTVSDMTKDRT
jgi:hypothetical protein